MRLLTHKILTPFFMLLGLLSTYRVFASDASDDISDPNYRIRLENMDPLIASHT